MNNLDQQYLDLLRDIREHGVKKIGRNGTTYSVFGRTIRHKMAEGFPLLTTKKMHWPGIVHELLWFLNGDTQLQTLLKNNVGIWTGDAYKRFERAYGMNELFEDLRIFLPPADCINEDGSLIDIKQFAEKIKHDKDFAEDWGNLGPIYGYQWRNFGATDDLHPNGVDQIADLVKTLKTNPDDRRMMVSAWNPTDIGAMILPPCHYAFQVYTRELSFEEQLQWVMWNTDVEMENLAITERAMDQTTPKRAISLMWNQRSVDVGLGWPFNVASYGLLLSMLGHHVNMIPDELICSLGDTHIYENQMEGLEKQLERTPFALPTLKICDRKVKNLWDYCFEDFEILNYQSHPHIKLPLSN